MVMLQKGHGCAVIKVDTFIVLAYALQIRLHSFITFCRVLSSLCVNERLQQKTVFSEDSDSFNTLLSAGCFKF